MPRRLLPEKSQSFQMYQRKDAMLAAPPPALDPWSKLRPSASPLVLLIFSASLIGRVVRVYSNVEDLSGSPLYVTSVPPQRRVLFSGIYAGSGAPDSGGILTIEDAQGPAFHAFQLAWGGGAVRRAQCGPPESFGFRFQSASRTFVKTTRGAGATTLATATVASEHGTGLCVDTIASRPTDGRGCENGSRALPWPWHVVCKVEEASAAPSARADALTQAMLSAVRLDSDLRA